MELKEAKMQIAQDFINQYYGFLNDIKTMESKDFGRKYGWQLESIKASTGNGKDNQKSLIKFQSLIYSGHWLPEWVRLGYSKQVIWDLNRAGFLSYQMYSNWNARATGRTDFYYISQEKAKAIHKYFKEK